MGIDYPVTDSFNDSGPSRSINLFMALTRASTEAMTMSSRAERALTLRPLSSSTPITTSARASAPPVMASIRKSQMWMDVRSPGCPVLH